MAEYFSVVCENISVTAAQDILAVYAASTKKLQLLSVEIAANNQATVGNYPIRVRYFPATVTAGTGGASVTPTNANPTGGTISATARRNDVTKATSSGTAVTYVSSMLNPINGYFWQSPMPVGDELGATISTAVTLELDSVTGTLNVSATMWLREV